MGFSLQWSNVSAVPDLKGSRMSAGRHVREQAGLAPGVTSVLDPVYHLQVSVDDSCKIYHLLRCERYLSISRRLALQGSRSCLSCAWVAEHRGDAIPRSFCCCVSASSSHSSTALLLVRQDSPNAVASLSF